MTTLPLTTEIAIARPAEPVWAYIADYANDPKWRDGVRSMIPTPSGLVKMGTTTDEVLRAAGRTYRNLGLVTDVTSLSFRWRTTDGVDADGSRTVIPTGATSCLVQLTLNVRLRGAQRLAAPMFRAMLQRTLTTDGERLKSVMEKAT
ncbi:SRPBCC family protein [Dactylosporangium sp. NPDC005572]|uniref:SRPBCC family protein n=1 Tax=Dactylosporangium sp. NPDC005572 TaxID=3156889 RepID=UPI0033B65B88